MKTGRHTSFIMRRLTSACIAAAISLFMAPPAHAARGEDFDPNHPERMTVTPDVTVRNYVAEGSGGVPYVSVIFTGGETVWVSPLFDELMAEDFPDTYRQLWMKGRLSEDRSKLTIPGGTLAGEGQIGILRRPHERFYICPMVYRGGDDSFNTWAVDDSAGDIVMSISPEGDMSLLGADDTHGVGVVTQYGVVGFTSWIEGKDIVYGPYVINGLRLRPADLQTVMPPPGLPVEDYQFLYTEPTEDPDRWDYRETVGRWVRSVTDGDDIYFQGLSYGDPGGWIAGKIGGGKVTFPAGEFSSLNTQTRYFYSPGRMNRLFAAREDKGYDGFKPVCDYIPLEGDLVFEYESVSGALTPSGEDAVMMFTDGPDHPVRYRCNHTQDGWQPYVGHDDVFKSPVLKRVPPGPQIPRQPVVDYENRKIKGSYYDIDKNVMRADSLFFRVYVNGERLMFYQDMLYNYWFEEPVAEVPVSMLYTYKERSDKDAYCCLSFRENFPDGAEVTAELVYYQDGAEHSSSGVGPVTGDSTSGDAVAPVYDLAGRKVSPENLRPGIYIRGNQKIIVR